MNNTANTAKRHNMFACTCKSCQGRYFAWCDSPAIITPDARWNRYDAGSPIKAQAESRGFVSNSDLMCCGYSLIEVWEQSKAARLAVAA